MDILKIVDLTLWTDIIVLDDSILKLFQRMDKDGDNRIKRNELATLMTSLSMDNRETRRRKATTIMSDKDTDGNKNLDQREFREWVMGKLNSTNIHATIDNLNNLLAVSDDRDFMNVTLY